MGHVRAHPSRLEIAIERPFEKADQAELLIKGLSPGQYRLTGCGGESVIESDGELLFDVRLDSDNRVVIERA